MRLDGEANWECRGTHIRSRGPLMAQALLLAWSRWRLEAPIVRGACAEGCAFTCVAHGNAWQYRSPTGLLLPCIAGKGGE